ncbi:MAG: ABC transporter permease [Chitinophagales bacterium]|nr:ABC transporter permease [Chitinophagales bacterium]
MALQLQKSISSRNNNIRVYMGEVWKARALITTFALRDLRLQYAQTYLGVFWSFIQPLTALLIFHFFFQRVIHINLHVPYSVFACTGMMGWFLFTQLVGQSGTALMNNQQLIRKIQFPRLVLPVAKVINGLVEFSVILVMLVVLMLVTGCSFSFKIVWLPLVVAANILVGLSVGIWLSALTIRFRDMHHIIPFLIGFGIWVTPVFYPTTMVPEGFNLIYYFHPVANIIALYRWIFIDWPINFMQVFVSFFIAAVLLVSGLAYFIRNEKFIADYL